MLLFKFSKECKGDPKLKVELTRCYIIKGQPPRPKQERKMDPRTPVSALDSFSFPTRAGCSHKATKQIIK